MSKKCKPFVEPTEKYLDLAKDETGLIYLWNKADQFNRRFGSREWDDVWYGYGRYPIGFKHEVQQLVGWERPKTIQDGVEVKQHLRTSDAYNIVYDELIRLLQRSKRQLANAQSSNPSSRIEDVGVRLKDLPRIEKVEYVTTRKTEDK